jgi:hypothetical protein
MRVRGGAELEEEDVFALAELFGHDCLDAQTFGNLERERREGGREEGMVEVSRYMIKIFSLTCSSLVDFQAS